MRLCIPNVLCTKHYIRVIRVWCDSLYRFRPANKLHPSTHLPTAAVFNSYHGDYVAHLRHNISGASKNNNIILKIEKI
ncbi:hypothetical protein Y032_0201g1747 [Ancylostoma ceylanicum]|uniref:Uncharacterized protein n=1 Tax=Ancylostoma ceylanicum TaxID=53326 RepID=A0A016SMJ7_9BILA|nr:hypothetical protein Y032_0201g1747 [Ancylostoma ceylanicum]